jgi:hypothetical protein
MTGVAPFSRVPPAARCCCCSQGCSPCSDADVRRADREQRLARRFPNVARGGVTSNRACTQNACSVGASWRRWHWRALPRVETVAARRQWPAPPGARRRVRTELRPLRAVRSDPAAARVRAVQGAAAARVRLPMGRAPEARPVRAAARARARAAPAAPTLAAGARRAAPATRALAARARRAARMALVALAASDSTARRATVARLEPATRTFSSRPRAR